MSVSFVQQSKDLYAASFSISHNGYNIGQLNMKGKLGSKEGVWQGTVMGRSVVMQLDKSGTGFRPYSIKVDGNIVGSVSQMTVKTGLFSSYQYHQLVYNGTSYQLYAMCLGKAGSASSLYCGQQQLAEINKDATVYNDLHNYEVFALDEHSAFICMLLCCYMYVRGCYRPGEKVTSSVVTSVGITTTKALKEKYNPNFKSTHSFY